MPDITYTSTDTAGLDAVAPLWEKQKAHHVARSVYFKHVPRKTWPERRAELLKKASGGILVDTARDAAGAMVGYCVTTINKENTGEIDSIYVEPDCRHYGIGSELMQRALAWLDEKGVKRRLLAIGEGNEEVIAFYRRFGFEVRATIMEQLPDRQPPA